MAEVVTFGCRLNLAESEAIRHATAGLDAVVVNTCAVTTEAVSQARQRIRKLHRERPERAVVVTGCAAQIEPQTFAAMPEVFRVLGNGEKFSRERYESGNRVSVGALADLRDVQPLRLPAEASTRAIVAVQNGCDHACTFCIIPQGRGASRSVTPDEAVADVRRLVEAGHREVVLTGVDLTSYAFGLGALVRRILREVPDLPRLRLSSIDSVEADADLVAAFAEEPRLMPHLHLSLQAGDDLILKRMKRRHLRADAVAFCARVRELRPEIVFGADLIAGFPTETEAMFSGTLQLVEDCGLTHLHIFPFSPRPGTPAARMPPVSPAVARERAARLRERGEVALRSHLDGEVGAERVVLAEAGGIGRTEAFTPVVLPPGVARNSLIPVTIAGHDGKRLIAA